MKALITGGAGFIGSHLAEELISQEYDIVILDNLSSGKMENLYNIKNEIRFIDGDIRNSYDVSKAMKGIDTVYHLAAAVSVPLSVENPELVFDVNVNGTKNVLKSAMENKIRRFVFISSAAVYGDCRELPVKETSELKPPNPYAESKVLGEAECQKYKKYFKVSILRCFNVYGPRQQYGSYYSGVISNFIENVKAGKPVTIFGDGKQTRDFIFVKDVVDVITKAPEGLFNVGTGKATSILDLVEILEKIVGRKIEIEFKKGRLGDIKHSVADISKLGFKPKYILSDGLIISSRSTSFQPE